jgi:hypothetical protein
MSSYNYYDTIPDDLINRFDTDFEHTKGYEVIGLKHWREFIPQLLQTVNQAPDEPEIRKTILNQIRDLNDLDSFAFPDGERQPSTPELVAILLLRRLKKENETRPKNNCPRLFISHRQADKKQALDMAHLTHSCGFAFWIDVLDPNLRILTKDAFSEKLIPLITACIIEMALMNCTHVLACMTSNSQGSFWIPYEYGRITEIPGIAKRACAWMDTSFNRRFIPEYMLLGEIAVNKKGIRSWLKNEKASMKPFHCHPRKSDLSGISVPLSSQETSVINLDENNMLLERAEKNGIGRNDIPVKPEVFRS